MSHIVAAPIRSSSLLALSLGLCLAGCGEFASSVLSHPLKNPDARDEEDDGSEITDPCLSFWFYSVAGDRLTFLSGGRQTVNPTGEVTTDAPIFSGADIEPRAKAT